MLFVVDVIVFINILITIEAKRTFCCIHVLVDDDSRRRHSTPDTIRAGLNRDDSRKAQERKVERHSTSRRCALPLTHSIYYYVNKLPGCTGCRTLSIVTILGSMIKTQMVVMNHLTMVIMVCAHIASYIPAHGVCVLSVTITRYPRVQSSHTPAVIRRAIVANQHAISRSLWTYCIECSSSNAHRFWATLCHLGC